MVQMEKDVIVNRLNNMTRYLKECAYPSCGICKNIGAIFHKTSHVLGAYPNPMLEMFD